MTEKQEFAKAKEIIIRRKWWIIWPFLSIVFITAVVCVALPNVYMSTATILIRDQQIPPALVPSTVTTYAEERIQSTTQEIMSRTRILKLVEKYDLLPDKRYRLTTEELVKRIRKRLTLSTINAEINKETQSQPVMLTIAFSLAYEDESPRKAQMVTNEVASYYLEKNAEAREMSAEGATKFLDEQMRLEKDKLDRLRTKIADFREEHIEETPDFMQVNIQKLETLNQKVGDIGMQMRSMEEQKATLKGNIAVLDPYAGGGKVIGPSDRLVQARIERTHLLGKYSENHPAILALNEEIRMLESGGSEADLASATSDRLTELESKLYTLQARYGSQHPDVLRTEAELEQLRKEAARLRSGNASSGRKAGDAPNPTNPAYIGLEAELERIDVSISSLGAEKHRLDSQIKTLYDKMQSMPQVAKQYSEMEAEYQILMGHYNELQHKLLTARVSSGMEEGRLGESFEVVEPPFLPEEHYSPNRLVIMLVGILFGSVCSFGAVALKELTDRRLHGAASLADVSGFPVIAILSRVVTEEDRALQRKRTKVVVISAFVGFISVLAVFHIFVMPLNVLSAKLERIMWNGMP